MLIDRNFTAVAPKSQMDNKCDTDNNWFCETLSFSVLDMYNGEKYHTNISQKLDYGTEIRYVR